MVPDGGAVAKQEDRAGFRARQGRPSRREIPEPGSRDGLGQEGTRDHGSPHTGPGRTHCSWQYMSQVRARQGTVMQREAGALCFHQSESLREASVPSLNPHIPALAEALGSVRAEWQRVSTGWAPCLPRPPNYPPHLGGGGGARNYMLDRQEDPGFQPED